MRVLFAGTPHSALPVLADLIAAPEHEVVGVLTRADARQGRGRRLQASPVAALARSHNLRVATPSTLKDASVQQWIKDLQADVAVVVAYGLLVPKALLDVPKHGWINLHFSLLPAWRGAAPVQRAIMAGDALSGISIFKLETGLDTGPIYARLTETIAPRDTSGQLLERLAQAGVGLTKTVLTQLATGSAVSVAQSQEGISLAPRLEAEEGEVRWHETATRIDRLVRAVTPHPGAYTTYQGMRLRLGPLTVAAQITDLPPGMLQATKHHVWVGTGGCAVELGQVALAGKKWMPADAWARGYRPAPGTILGV